MYSGSRVALLAVHEEPRSAYLHIHTSLFAQLETGGTAAPDSGSGIP